MTYYNCPKFILHNELNRRGFHPSGPQDTSAERLHKDDLDRGADATTISTLPLPSPHQKWRLSPEFGKEVDARLLINECITHWTLNTFFPSLHLFFESDLSVHIEASHVPSAAVGLDAALRSRLTDLTHEENGVLTNTILPCSTKPSIRILDARLSLRTSTAVKQLPFTTKDAPVDNIVGEQHVVVGLRLEGMSEMGYVWGRVEGVVELGEVVDGEIQGEERRWGNVRVAGMRNDVPVPFVRFPVSGVRKGEEARVVVKGSLVKKELRGIEWDGYV